MLDILALALRGAVMALVLAAAWEDLRHMRIRNDIALAVALLFLPMVLVLPLKIFGVHLAVGLVFFLIAVAMFFMRLFGGGDAKLLGALGLWIDILDVPAFLLIMTVAGGVLGLVSLALRRNTTLLPRLAANSPDDGWFAALARGQKVVPYGLAIALACACTLFR